MGTTTFVQYSTWLVYVALFLVTLVQAIRRPRRATINIALFFGLPAFLIVLRPLIDPVLSQRAPIIGAINGTLILSLAYVLMRLVGDFTIVSSWFMRLMEVLLILLCAGLFVWTPPRPSWLTVLQVIYFVGLQFYAALAFVQASTRASGVTKRRMRAVALGSILIGLTILVPTLPALTSVATVVSQFTGLASGMCYFVGFAPPRALRRAWQEPELRAFLGRAARLPRLPTTVAIVRELEVGAATSVGSPYASIGLWNETTQQLEFVVDGGTLKLQADADLPVVRAYTEQRPIFVAEAPREFSPDTEAFRGVRPHAILVAPITAGATRLGVLTVYAPRAPIFAEDDLDLVVLLADQAAVILESRSLIDEAARVRAREEATRLKDDFLSAAAHELKTPLTTLSARAQLLERRALRNPDAPAELVSIRAMVSETHRLETLVLELLDAARAERGQLVGALAPVDLVELAAESCARISSEQHQWRLDAPNPILGAYDRNRVTQLLDNLLENAVKYSPAGGEVALRVWAANSQARMQVADQGIGVPVADLPFIFDRFFRANNVDDRRFMGMGLGLFICKAIAEQHGGRIWASPREGGGTVFDVELPINLPGVAQ